MIEPAYSDGLATCYQGDALAVLRELPAASVDCVVTSPPYWGLRDYGTGAWEGGDPACEHRGVAGRGGDLEDQRKAGALGHVPGAPNRGGDPARCRCGAVRVDSQLGLEPTPELYVEHMVAVFREVRRVMRLWATLWLNMGDCYASSVNGQAVTEKRRPGDGAGTGARACADDRAFRDKPRSTVVGGLKTKDLVGMPWRLAFALQADGWYLRSDIIYSKPNPMPESVTDRPTKSHEYLFLLSRSTRYYYDAEAIREVADGDTHDRGGRDAPAGWEHASFAPGAVRGERTALTNRSRKVPDGWDTTPGPHGTIHRGGRQAALARGDDRYRGAEFPKDVDGRTARLNGAGADPLSRNKRSVWEIATQPYPGLHYATFPDGLVIPCIRAGTSERGCCPDCGRPWRRVLERETVREHGGTREMSKTPLPVIRAGWRQGGPVTTTTGWVPTCTAVHHGAPVPCTVLDPFAGSGTTLAVAKRLGRWAVGIELSAKYIRDDLARRVGEVGVSASGEFVNPSGRPAQELLWDQLPGSV